VIVTGLVVGAVACMFVAAFVYAWRNRPYRGPGAEHDNAWRDEMAMEASKFVNRTHDMGADVGGDL
jgi:hypothetical protein